jgi:hypothetical protein
VLTDSQYGPFPVRSGIDSMASELNVAVADRY